MYKIITKNKIVNNSFFFSTIVKLIIFTIKVGILSIMLIQHLQ